MCATHDSYSECYCSTCPPECRYRRSKENCMQLLKCVVWLRQHLGGIYFPEKRPLSFYHTNLRAEVRWRCWSRDSAVLRCPRFRAERHFNTLCVFSHAVARANSCVLSGRRMDPTWRCHPAVTSTSPGLLDRTSGSRTTGEQSKARRFRQNLRIERVLFASCAHHVGHVYTAARFVAVIIAAQPFP